MLSAGSLGWEEEEEKEEEEERPRGAAQPPGGKRPGEISLCFHGQPVHYHPGD